jgi:hypothetical protein
LATNLRKYEKAILYGTGDFGVFKLPHQNKSYQENIAGVAISYQQKYQTLNFSAFLL